MNRIVFVGFLLGFSTINASGQGLNGVLELEAKPTHAGQAGIIFDINNSGTKVPTELGYGLRTIYTNLTPGKTTYDTGAAFHSAWQQASTVAGSQVFGTWVIAEGPADQRSIFGVVGTEIDVVNRGGDTGWTPFRGSLPRFSAVLQLVPEANTFTHGGTPYNITASLVIGQSPGPRSDGAFVKTYSGILIEPNAIAAGGRALTFTGDTTSAAESATMTPFGIATVLGNWSHGIDTTKAGIFDNLAVKLASAQSVGWISGDGQPGARVGSDATGDLILAVPNQGSFYLAWGGVSRKVSVGALNSAGPGARALTVPN